MNEPYPSNPTRPSKCCLYFTGYTDGEEEFFAAHTYAELFSAHRWLTTIIGEAKPKWLDEDTIILTTDNHTLKLKSYQMEDVMGYSPTKTEKAWQLDRPALSYINRIMYFWKKPEPKKQPTISKSKPVKRHQTQKEAPKGMITVAIIAEEYDLTPNKARNLLRKAGMKKPSNGWTYKKKAPEVEEIRALFKKNS